MGEEVKQKTHLIQAHSSSSLNNNFIGTVPNVDRLEFGELSVNINDGLENLSVKGKHFKNGENVGHIVPFILNIKISLDEIRTIDESAYNAVINAKVVILNNELQLLKKKITQVDNNKECSFSCYDASIDKEHVLKVYKNVEKNQFESKYSLSDEILHDVFSTFDGIEVIQRGSSLNDVEEKVGKLVYDINTDEYYSYSDTKEWMTMTKFYVGSDEPNSKTVLWVDNNGPALTSRENDELRYLRQQIYNLNMKCDDIYRIFEQGVVPGNSLTSTKSSLLNSFEEEEISGSSDSSEVIELYRYDQKEKIERVNTYYKLTSEDIEPEINEDNWTNSIGSIVTGFSEDNNYLWFYNAIKLVGVNEDIPLDKVYKLCTYDKDKKLSDVFIYYRVTIDNAVVPEKNNFFTLESAEKISEYINSTNNVLWCYLECVYAYEKPNIGVDSGATVPHNCAKIDTRQNFSINRSHLYDGELLFYSDEGQETFAIYYKDYFYLPRGSGSGGGGISVDDLYNLPLDYLIFSNNGKEYNVKVTDTNKFSITQQSKEINEADSKDSFGVFISHLLTINTVYTPKTNVKIKKSLCSHSFVELANASKSDINLNGLYLLYSNYITNSDGKYEWKILPLKGIIKAESTFLIRGAQSQDYKISFIKVDTFDMEWFISNEGKNELISFDEQGSFYLIATNEINKIVENGLGNPYEISAPKGYVDLFGYSFNEIRPFAEGNSPLIMKDKDRDRILMFRLFMMETASQGKKVYEKRKTSDLWTYVDLIKQPNTIGNKKELYFDDDRKLLYAPKSSMEGKNFFTTRTKFSSLEPNMVFIGLGIEGTDNSPNGITEIFHESGATRCFNWISVGYYDEYVYYRKKDSNQWFKKYSFVDSDFSGDDKRIYFYRRFRWCTSDGTWVTTHKAIISGLTAGEYEFYIKREGNEHYSSSINTFKVAHTNNVSKFSFIHTSDQQGFNYQEYSVWEKCSYAILSSETQNDFEFIINTGDATQSGNRVSEWMDYYNGRKYLRNYPEMYSIGNNDLCGYIDTDLTDGNKINSKLNHINVRRYFMFEIDENNIPIFDWEFEYEESGKTITELYENCPIDSLYSFNYGKYHFISLNSEVAKHSSKMYRKYDDFDHPGDSDFAEKTYAKVEKWLEKDLEIYRDKFGITEVSGCSKCIVYCHEMPFTILKLADLNVNQFRGGSNLNTLNKNGKYRFSRLFYKYGIRLVLGGHKHTYSISKPIYDAPDDWDNTWSPSEDRFISGTVIESASQRPVIQVKKGSEVNNSDFCRYEFVDKITAPTYVMTQATGYKLVSNADIPSPNTKRIPWILAYYPSSTEDGSVANILQYHPMYLRYDLEDDKITIFAKQVQKIYNEKSYDYNNQKQENSEIVSVTLTTNVTKDDDYKIYGNRESRDKYIIYL